MPDHKSKSSSVVKSISKQLTKIASSTSNSNSDENTPPPGYIAKVATATIIDDVPLNKKVEVVEEKRKSNAKSRTTVVGSKDLKLKVSHNEAGRVVISVSNPEKILVQVHVDESVFKKKRSSGASTSGSSSSILKKKKKTSSKTSSATTTKTSSKKEDKDRPKKKSNTLAKQKSKKVLPSTSSSSGKKMSSSSSSSRRRANEPRDLPDEQSSGRGRDRTSSGGVKLPSNKTRSSSMDSTTRKKKLLKPATKNFTAHFSSMISIASGLSRGEASHCSEGSDDSTRSPLDLNRCNTAPPKTTTPPKKAADAFSTELDMIMMDATTDLAAVAATAPTWDRRRQMMKLKRQNSKLMDEPPHLHDDFGRNRGTTEAKTEETAHPQPGEDEDEELSVFSSPLQQRRLQHRQKRLEKQKAEGEEIFRSTRSIRTAHSNISNPMAPLPATAMTTPAAAPNTRPLDPPSMELDASATNTTTTPAASFPAPLMPEKSQASMATGSSKSSGNRARHTRTSVHQIPHEDDDDDSATCNTNIKGQQKQQQRRTSSMIRQTIDNVRKVEMVNKGDRFSGRSSYRKKDEADEKMMQALSSKTGSNLFTKIRDKVTTSSRDKKKSKRQKKDPKPQQQDLISD